MKKEKFIFIEYTGNLILLVRDKRVWFSWSVHFNYSWVVNMLL